MAMEYDEALKAFQRVLDAKNLPPEMATVIELSMSMVPQVMVAKAAKMEAVDQRRKTTLEDAVKHALDSQNRFPSLR